MNIRNAFRVGLASLAVVALGAGLFGNAPVANAAKVTPAAVTKSSPKTFVNLVRDVDAELVPSGVLNGLSGFSIVEDDRGWYNEVDSINIPTADIPVTGGDWNPEGVYLVTFDVDFSANTTGRRMGMISLNGSTNYVAQVAVPAVSVPSNRDTIIQVTKVIRLHKGDALTFITKHDGGGQLHIATKVTLSGPIAL